MATGTIGAKIVLEGEASYRKALRDIKTAQAELRSEMKLCNTQFAESQNSMDALNKKYEILSKQVETSAKKVETYEKALKSSTQREQEASNRIAQLQTNLERAEAEYEKMSKSSETTAEAMESQKDAIAKLEKELQNANTDYDKAVESTQKYQTQLNLANAEMTDFDNQLKQTERLLNEADNSVDGCATSIDEYGKEVVDAGEKTISFGDILKANLSSDLITAGIKSLVRGIKEVASACIETGMEFESAMSNVQALSGANATELEKLSDKAKELGASTIYSASEVADAMSYMALAGWNTEQTLSGISSVLDLAAASTMDLASASDIVTDYLTAFGLSAKDAEHFTDQLAYAMSSSNTTVEMLGESYKNCAATASSLGYSVEDVTAVLMTMANAGVKGGEAGSGLSTIMTRLATNTKNCGDALAEYGINIYDAEGNMNSLSSILEGMAEIWGTLSDQEQSALAKTIAGTNQYSKLQTIMSGLSDNAKDAGMSFGDYAKALTECDGAASKMAKTMQDNLKGKVTALESAMDGLKISVSEVFDDSLKKGVDGATDAISRLNKSVSNGQMNVSLNKMAQSLELFMSNAISVGEEALPKLIDAFTWILDNGTVIASSIAAITASIKIQEIVSVIAASWSAYATATEGATVAQWLLNAAMDANPIGILITALAGLTAGMIAYGNQLDAETQSAKLEIEANEKLIQSFQDSKKQREEYNKSLNADAEVTKSLVEKLLTLNSSYDGSNEQMVEQKRIIDELNSVFPDLNLSIDEQTNKLNMSTDALKKNVNEMMRMSLAAAAQEDLADIANDLYEAEKLLNDETNKLSQTQEEMAFVERQLDFQRNKLATTTDTYAGSTEETSRVITEYENELYSLQETERQQTEAQENAKNAVEVLKEEYQNTLEIIDQYSGTVDSASEEINGLGDAAENTSTKVVALSEETTKAITDMYDSVSKSISGQMDLFSEFSASEAKSAEELKNNLDGQIQALNTWADDMAKLAERGIDENLYKKLAEMGPEGANYAKTFVDMSDEELKKYGEKFSEAIKLQDSTAQQVAADYATVSEYIAEGIAQGIEDNTSTATDAIKKLAEDTIEAYKEENGIHSPSEVYAELAGYITEGMKEGLDNGEQDVLDSMETLADDTISTAENKLKYSGEFEDIGYNISAGIASGISSGSSDVVDAITSVCDSAINAAKTKLQIHSPSKVFEWMGEMSGEGYINGLQDSMSGVNDAINNAMSSASNVGTVATTGSDAVNQLLNVVAEYLPEIADKNQSVSVSLEGDAKGLFNAVRKQNTIYSKANGVSAFA